MIRVRAQTFLPGKKRASVEIISVDQFTTRARKIDKTQTERQHLMKLLATAPVYKGADLDTYSLYTFNNALQQTQHLFWLEKP